MNGALPHISVCICTFKRPILLKRLLQALTHQETEDEFTYSVVVADNDKAESARAVASEFGDGSSVHIVYCVEPEQNIAKTRNKTLENAEGEYVAFIDDDEFPPRKWLGNLLRACLAHGVDGVLGPVNPHFEENPPDWATKGRFFERPRYPTGHRIGLADARTGNVLFAKRIIDESEDAFRAEYGTGGEDVDFFRRMMERGRVFIWCDEAPVYESVPSSRCRRSYLLRRALLRGSNSLRQPVGRRGRIVKSLLAVPLYALALPVFLIAGQHIFLKYLIKLSDHVGRLLALIGLNPIRQRDM